MPEIAEVRTVARTLNKSIVGRKIIGIDTPYDKIIKTPKDEFIDTLTNKTFKEVSNIVNKPNYERHCPRR